MIGDYIVLYGSLRMGLPANRALKLERAMSFISLCKVNGDLYDFGEYPGLVMQPDWHEITADLCKIKDPNIIQELDEYEDFDPEKPEGSMYLREEIIASDVSGTNTYKAWTYIYNIDADIHNYKSKPVIQSGDWKQHILAR